MSAGEETLESLRKRAEEAEKKVEWLERKKGTVADLAGAAHRWNVKERARLTTRAEDAETKWAEAVEVLGEFKSRSELIAQRPCTGSISSREAHARGTGYAEAAKAGLAALRGDNA